MTFVSPDIWCCHQQSNCTSRLHAKFTCSRTTRWFSTEREIAQTSTVGTNHGTSLYQ